MVSSLDVEHKSSSTPTTTFVFKIKVKFTDDTSEFVTDTISVTISRCFTNTITEFTSSIYFKIDGKTQPYFVISDEGIVLNSGECKITETRLLNADTNQQLESSDWSLQSTAPITLKYSKVSFYGQELP